jgi:hypothetical protein
MDLGTDQRRLAIEIIATLVHVKNNLVEFVLKPAGVPAEIYRPLLYGRDPNTGKIFSKRQIAPLILDAVEQRPNCSVVLRSILEIAANWQSYHLADDEYVARAVSHKAREILGILETMQAREAHQREVARKEEVARMERERVALFERQSSLLLMMFEELARSEDTQNRGYLLQELLKILFDLHRIPLTKPFTRNARGEQIDGAFKLEGWHYLVECRWRAKLADIRELDGLHGQVGRSGKQAMGLFLSVNGWSDNVPKLLKQNPDKSIILMEGYDLRTVLSARLDLRDFLLAKLTKLTLESEPFFGVSAYMVAER